MVWTKNTNLPSGNTSNEESPCWVCKSSTHGSHGSCWCPFLIIRWHCEGPQLLAFVHHPMDILYTLHDTCFSQIQSYEHIYGLLTITWNRGCIHKWKNATQIPGFVLCILASGWQTILPDAAVRSVIFGDPIHRPAAINIVNRGNWNPPTKVVTSQDSSHPEQEQ